MKSELKIRRSNKCDKSSSEYFSFNRKNYYFLRDHAFYFAI